MVGKNDTAARLRRDTTPNLGGRNQSGATRKAPPERIRASDKNKPKSKNKPGKIPKDVARAAVRKGGSFAAGRAILSRMGWPGAAIAAVLTALPALDSIIPKGGLFPNSAGNQTSRTLNADAKKASKDPRNKPKKPTVSRTTQRGVAETKSTTTSKKKTAASTYVDRPSQKASKKTTTKKTTTKKPTTKKKMTSAELREYNDAEMRKQGQRG